MAGRTEERMDQNDLRERMDADLGVISGALQAMIPDLEVTEFAEYKFASEGYLLPEELNPSGVIGAGVDSITYQRITHVGAWQLASDYATVIEESDFVFEEPVTYGAKYFQTKMSYSSQELDRMNFANSNRRMGITVDLTEQKYNSVLEGYYQLKNKLFSFGLPKVQIYGLLSHPDIPRVTMPFIPGASFTARENLDLLDNALTIQLKTTKEVEQSDTLLMDLTTARFLNMQTLGDANTTSVLKYWLENNGYVQDIETTPQNDIAGSFGQPAWLYYKRDSRKVCPCVPKKMTQIGAPQPKGTRIEVYYDAQVSGVHYKRPYSAILYEFPVAG